MTNLPDESFVDVSGRVKQTSSNKHQHPVNLRVHPGTAKPSDFDTKGVEVPARAARERVDPSVAATQRRKPMFDITTIAPSGSGNHDEVRPPKAL